MINNSKIKCMLDSNAGYGLTVLRIIVGIIFIAHGSQKLFGAFGGYGLEGTAGYFATIGLSPAYLMAFLAGASEFFGGLFLLLGLLTRFAGIILAFLSTVALFTVHLHNGFFMSANGIEYILVLLSVSIAFIMEGSGKFSLDQLIIKHIIKGDK